MNLFGHLGLPGRADTPPHRMLSVKVLLVVVGSYMITLAALLAGSAHFTRSHMISDRVAKLEAVVEVAENTAGLLEAEVAAGRMTRAQALDRFRDFIYSTRYNGEEYVFVYDFDGNVTVLGNDRGVQGHNRFELRDHTGKPFIQEMLATAHGTGGTVSYWYPRKPGQAAVPKLAFVKAFPPWGIFIGTGVYVGDMDAVFQNYVFNVSAVAIGALAVAAALAMWIGRDVAASVSERRSAEAKIIHLAHHDTLTGLPNRAYFQDALTEAVTRANRDPADGMALLVCDLDRFKEVNDTFGHPAGDELLRQAATRMLGAIRKDDILARLGGDEFAFALTACPHVRQAQSLASRVTDVLSRPFDVQGHAVTVGVSIGIALAPADATDPVELMMQADTALYVSKHRARGTASVYRREMSQGMQERLELEADLRRAAGQGEFLTYYQPIVDLASGGIAGFEALVRWQHPSRGLLAPDRFIETAEDCGLLTKVGEEVLRAACRDASGWGGGVRVAVNVAAQQLMASEFPLLVEAALDDAGLAAERLELEITERVMLNDSETVRSVLMRLRARGIHISLDDFGTGYSSLSYLQKFPVDRIKIDRSFVCNMGTAAEADAIVRAMVSLGSILGIRTLAEGIETEDQARRVLEARCNEGQGFLYSRPVPASEVAAVMERLNRVAVMEPGAQPVA